MEDFDKELEDDFHLLQQKEKAGDEEIHQIEVKIRRFSLVAWIFVFTGFVLIIFGVLEHAFLRKWELNLLGDFWGGSLASVWSLAALLFIFVAFLGQKQQLINQQKEVRYSQFELKATRVEILRQRQQLEEQNINLKRQRFENTFFHLMTLHADIVKDLDIVSGKKVTESGSDCFSVIFDEFCELYEKSKPASFTSDDEELAYINRCYCTILKRYRSEIEHYFRHLYHIVKFIHNSDLDDKKQYTNFVRSQLSSHELLCMFYNVVSEKGSEKFKPLVEAYCMLKNLPLDELPSLEHKRFIAKSAYDSE